MSFKFTEKVRECLASVGTAACVFGSKVLNIALTPIAATIKLAKKAYSWVEKKLEKYPSVQAAVETAADACTATVVTVSAVAAGIAAFIAVAIAAIPVAIFGYAVSGVADADDESPKSAEVNATESKS